MFLVIKDQATLDADFSAYKLKNNRTLQKTLRKKYNFHPDLYFRSTSYVLFLAHQKKENPEKTYKELITISGNWKNNITEIQLSNFERQSKRLRDIYDKQNKQAALEAIKNHDWMALKVNFDHFI